jgi:CHAT domain-containing protein
VQPASLLALGDPAFARPGAAPVAALPGTRREVAALARLFDRAEVLLGSDASEQRLDALAAAGRLREFRYLHFATHGRIDDQAPLRSVLLLARDRLPDPAERVLAGQRPYDGRLTAERMLQWRLDAELVILSACETGLGRRDVGEGYVGFAQALFLAGARSLVLSLWPVDDTATALLMVRFYENLLGRRPGLDRPLARAEALREARQWLRSLTAPEVEKAAASLPAVARGERERPPAPSGQAVRPYAHPHYWAAFILIGDPD